MKPKRESRTATPSRPPAIASAWIHQKVTRKGRPLKSQLKGLSAGSVRRTETQKAKLLKSLELKTKLLDLEIGHSAQRMKRRSSRIQEKEDQSQSVEASLVDLEKLTPIVVMERVKSKRGRRHKDASINGNGATSDSSSQELLQQEESMDESHLLSQSTREKRRSRNDSTHLETWLTNQMEVEVSDEVEIAGSSTENNNAFDLSCQEAELEEATIDAIEDANHGSQKPQNSNWSCIML